MDDLKAKKIFNTCYSGLNFFSQTSTTLKHEITEMALIELPRTSKYRDHCYGSAILLNNAISC